VPGAEVAGMGASLAISDADEKGGVGWRTAALLGSAKGKVTQHLLICGGRGAGVKAFADEVAAQHGRGHGYFLTTQA